MASTHKANNAILNDYFRDTSLRGEPWIGLSTTLIDDYGNGAVEPPSGSGYNRFSGSSIGWEFDEIEGSASNTTALLFPECIGTWGTIVELFIANASTGGDIFYHTKLNPSIPTYAGTQITINGGTLLITERI